jgi:hypothetical protein
MQFQTVVLSGSQGAHCTQQLCAGDCDKSDIWGIQELNFAWHGGTQVHAPRVLSKPPCQAGGGVGQRSCNTSYYPTSLARPATYREKPLNVEQPRPCDGFQGHSTIYLPDSLEGGRRLMSMLVLAERYAAVGASAQFVLPCKTL